MLALIWLIATYHRPKNTTEQSAAHYTLPSGTSPCETERTKVSSGHAPVDEFILSPQVVIGSGASLRRNRTQVSEASLVVLVGASEEGQVMRSVICTGPREGQWLHRVDEGVEGED